MMQPWQESGESRKKSAQLPFKRMEQAANLLSYSVPASLAVKGLGKINPTLGKFFNLASNYGFSQEEAIDNVREKEQQSSQATEKKEGSFFEEMLGGVDPSQLPEPIQKQLSFLGMIAQQLEKKGVGRNDKQYTNLKKKIRDLLKGKSNVMLDEISREGMQNPMQQEAQQMQPEKSARLADLYQNQLRETEKQMGQPQMQPQMGQPQPQMQEQPQQSGPGQQALMAVLQKIQATRGQQ